MELEREKRVLRLVVVADVKDDGEKKKSPQAFSFVRNKILRQGCVRLSLCSFSFSLSFGELTKQNHTAQSALGIDFHFRLEAHTE